MNIKIKRVYEKTTRNDGFRVLVDRVWPRGTKKEDANIALWKKEIAPSSELRKWFSHDPKKWSEFQKKYKRELKTNPEWKDFKKEILDEKTITLVYGAKDTEHNQAIVLKQLLED